MGLFSGGNSKSTTENNQRQHTANDSATIVDAGGDVVITDGGAIAGNVSVANNALETAKTITQSIGDQSGEALASVKSLSQSFSTALESIKKTELTNGGSLFTDLMKWWPVIPVAVVAVFGIKKLGGKKNG